MYENKINEIFLKEDKLQFILILEYDNLCENKNDIFSNFRITSLRHILRQALKIYKYINIF